MIWIGFLRIGIDFGDPSGDVGNLARIFVIGMVKGSYAYDSDDFKWISMILY